MPRLLGPTLGMVESSKSCAVCRSSIVRKPALIKARAVPSVSPLRSQALDASQYSSNDKGLRLKMSVKPMSPFPQIAYRAVLSSPL